MKPPKMIDNKRNGTVAEELRQSIQKDSKLSIMTAYFTIFAFAELKKELLKVDSVRMLFTDPVFIKGEHEQIREYYLERNDAQTLAGNIYEIKVKDEVYIVYKNETSSIVSENNPDIEISLLEYRRIDNRGDLQRKGEILCTLSKKIESVEGKIKGTEYQALLNDTTFLLNKTGARHWVEKDKLASATFLKMQPEELEKWYDTTFDLIVSCLAVLSYLNIKNQIRSIRQTEVTTNETSI